MSFPIHRREFFAASVAAAGSALVAAHGEDATAQRRFSPNDRINLGFIGVGTMGRGHLGGFLGTKEVQVVAVCDVVAERRDDAKTQVEKAYGKGKKSGFHGCAAYADLRKLLDRSDIDAVVIATPDHWHAVAATLAARAKKHIYCEKPLTNNIAEGRRLVAEVDKAGVVFQTGSQQRSEFDGRFRRAVELVRNGRIGKIRRIRIGVGGPAKACDLPAQSVPAGTDWEMWVGPAPFHPYNDVLCPRGVHHHFPAWRNYREYGGGAIADMGAHHFDVAQWALDMDHSGPIEIHPPAKGESGLRYIYANGVEMIHGGSIDCLFEGETGVIEAARNYLRARPDKILKDPIGPGEFHVYPSKNHHRNWLECVRTHNPCICPAETGHRSATVCHLGNIGYRLRRTLKWDPVVEKFHNDDEANQLVGRTSRDPWNIG